MLDSEKQQLVDAVQARRNDMVRFTSDLVAVPSENPPGVSYGECIEVITHELDRLRLDFDVVSIPDESSDQEGAEYPRFAVVARYGDGDPAIHFHGHYDVVPSEDRAMFEPTIRAGDLIGRGSSDMKSGLASMVYAVDAMRACGGEIGGSVRIAMVPDEETGGVLGSRYLSDTGWIASDGIGMLTAEPTSGAIWNASRGAISLLVRVKGVPMHVGLQYDGVNAFDHMLAVANALTELKHEVEQRTTDFNIQPDEARKSILMLGGRCEGGSNFNLVPGEVSFTIDRRINPEEDLLTEKRRLLDVLSGMSDRGIELEIEVLQEGFSAGVGEEDRMARALAGNVELITGATPRFEMCPGLLEIRFYAEKGIPAFAYGPGILSVSHGPQEYVPIDSIVDCAAIYALTAREVLSERR